jgi:hypothetical protein
MAKSTKQAAKKTAPAKKIAAAVDVPTKVSEVKAWLAARPTMDAATLKSLAKRPKQKAAEMAAAVRALAQIGTSDALQVIATYRPKVIDGEAEHEGRFGDTFPDAVAREILAAWGRFDRRAFAKKIFSGLGSLWIAHGGEIEDLTGIGAAKELLDLRIFVSPTCDLAPLAACVELGRLEINVSGRTGGLEPIARIPALDHLAIINGHKLDQAAVDALAGAKLVARLYLTVGPTIDLHALTALPALKRLKLGAGDRAADARTAATLRELVRRGVDVCLYDHEKWPRDLTSGSIPGVASAVQGGYIVLTSDPSRVEALRASMSTFLV